MMYLAKWLGGLFTDVGIGLHGFIEDLNHTPFLLGLLEATIALALVVLAVAMAVNPNMAVGTVSVIIIFTAAMSAAYRIKFGAIPRSAAIIIAGVTIAVALLGLCMLQVVVRL